MKDNDLLRAFAVFTHIGFTIVACIAGSLFLGRFLDRTFSTEPLFILIFSILGIIAAIWSIMRFGITKKDKKDEKDLSDK